MYFLEKKGEKTLFHIFQPTFIPVRIGF